MTSPPHPPGGGAFLTRPEPEFLFSAEDLNETHHAISDTVKEFWDKEIIPVLKGILEHEPGLVRAVMKKAAEIGLMGLAIPERYGGMELDLVSSLVVAEQNARDASYMVWEGGHTTIGTLPIVYFGTGAQKRKYLPSLARLDLLAAYALTEPQAGSDAMAIRTRADLSPDGSHYILHGQKMWITNAGEADLFTVFAKVDGERFTAFLVERGFEGFRVGGEERKMGLRGSSTTALYLDGVPVPVDNVLGEVGRGHVIAFNILNFGRLKMGASTVGAAKEVLRQSVRYARERRAFGSPIADFGAIRHKLAGMTVGIYVTESIVWRTAGLIDRADGGVGWDDPEAGAKKLTAIREFALECSIVKVFGSEMLDSIVDEGVQIHGGYGYHEDYPVERAYRDSRINRIFEGTNEINRLLIARLLLRRASTLDPDLLEPFPEALTGEVAGASLVERAKRVARLALGLARERWGADLPERQETLLRLADIVIEIYAMESTVARSRKAGASSLAQVIAEVFSDEAMTRILAHAREVVGASSGDPARHMDFIHRLTETPPPNLIEARQKIAGRVIDQEGYAC
jgi:alkylation response protein AidB-like acyl-CoA dehydrogenase